MNVAIAPAILNQPADQQETLEAFDLALQLGEMLLRSGASTGRVVKIMRDVLAALGEKGVGVALTPELMTVTGGVSGVPYTVTRVSPRIAWNITRVAELEQLAERVAAGGVDRPQLRADMQRIGSLHSPYNRWMVIGAWACAGAFLSRLVGADWGGTVIAFLACAAGQYVRSEVGARANPGLITLVTATVAALIGALGVKLGLSQTPVGTLTASVALLIPGLWLITGALDVLSGRQIRFGIFRITVALLLFLTIVLGVYFAVAIIS